MKLRSISGSVLLLLLGALLSACQSTDSPQMVALRQQAEQTAVAAKKDRADQDDYISALQTYNDHRSKTPAGAEESLYKEYKTLLAKYTATITFFWPVNPGDKDPHLPVVAFPTEPITVEIIKADYINVAQDYRAVLKVYAAGVNYSLPPEPPPLPPTRSSDKDVHKLVTLEKKPEPGPGCCSCKQAETPFTARSSVGAVRAGCAGRWPSQSKTADAGERRVV